MSEQLAERERERARERESERERERERARERERDFSDAEEEVILTEGKTFYFAVNRPTRTGKVMAWRGDLYS